MKERPILFSGPMVCAILQGRKTQTRRLRSLGLINQAPDNWELMRQGALLGGWAATFGRAGSALGADDVMTIFCPYGAPGDRLWGRETWNCIDTGIKTQRRDWVRYRATDGDELHWRPSIHMPRWASRIDLDLTDVRVERVQSITPRDVVAEGIYHEPGEWGLDSDYTHLVKAFGTLWDDVNGAKPVGAWASNPWVWALTVKRI